MVSPSWGGPALFPDVFERGLRTLREDLGLDVVEMPNTRATPKALHRDPGLRVADLEAAFADDSIRAIFASIGGDDSVRLLPRLDLAALARRPKIVMGYSDTTTLLVALSLEGLVTFHGPSVMAGWAQAHAFPPAFLAQARALLFEGEAIAYSRYDVWSDGYPDWSKLNRIGQVKPPHRDDGPRVVQGRGRVRGALVGGCVEVLEMMRGTPWFPPVDRFAGRVLFLETSEDKPPPQRVRELLRSYGVAGILSRLRALLVGRPYGYTREEKRALDREIVGVVAGEMGLDQLPIVTNLEFGHTDPQIILPLGVGIEVDADTGGLRLVEPAVS